MKMNKLFGNQFKFSNRIIKNYGLKSFGGRNDIDFDGIPNRKDCQPFNTFRQDFTQATKKTDMSAAQKFGYGNIKRLKFLGHGRDRNVYALDNNKVLKVARNPQGIAQNVPESDLEGLYGLKHYETGKDYVVMERAEPPGNATSNMLRRLKKHGVNVYRNSDKNWNVFEEAGVETDVLNYDLAMGDFMKKNSWGEKNGQPVLIDGGTLSQKSIVKPIKFVTHNGYQRMIEKDKYPEKIEYDEAQRDKKIYTHNNPTPVKFSTTSGGHGKIVDVRNVPPEYHEGNDLMFTLQHDYGRKEYNVYPKDIRIKNPKDLEIPKQEERYEGLSLLPASIEKQQEWQQKPQEEKVVERIEESDIDKDGTPDEYDCQPENPEKQESPKMMLYRKGQLMNMLKKRYPNDYDNYDTNAHFDSGISARENKEIILTQAQQNFSDKNEGTATLSDVPQSQLDEQQIEAMRKFEEKEAANNIEKNKDVFDMRDLQVYDVDLPEYMVDHESFSVQKLSRY